MTVTLNGKTYANEDFVGADGRGYATRFPLPIFGDMLAEVGARDATIAGLISSQDAAITAKINALSLPAYVSLTSRTIGTGARAFTLTQVASVPIGTYRVASASSPTNFMIVRVTVATVSSTTLNTTSDVAVGTGTFTDWIITGLDAVARRGYRSSAVDTAVTSSDLNGIVQMTTGGSVLTLASLATLGNGFVLTITNSAVTAITLTPDGADTIDGAASLSLPGTRSITLVATTGSWRSIDRQILSHDLITGHTIAGLTSGHVLRATAATTMAFGAIQVTDLPTISQRAIRQSRVLNWQRLNGSRLRP